MITIKCKQCKKDFLTYYSTRILCSRECYSKHRSKIYNGEKHSQWKGGICSENKVCNICKKTFIGHKNRVVCSVKCMGLWQTKYGTKRGKNNGMWNGGKINGKYIRISSINHPNRNKAGYVLEHHLVMEKKIGRYLNKDEVVHHINRNKTDNRIENLQLMTKIEHDKLHLKEYRDKKLNK